MEGRIAAFMSSNRRAAVGAFTAAGLLLVCAVAVHQHANAPNQLLQTEEGMSRHMQALKELGEQSVLFGAERQAYQNGFLAGEQAAEKDVAEDDEGTTVSKDAMLERQAMLKHMLMANKVVKEQNQLADDAELEKEAMMKHMEAANSNLKQEDEKEAELMEKAAQLHADRMNKIAGLEKEENAFGKKLAAQEAAIKQAAEARLASKKIAAAPVQLAQPGSPQAQKLLAFCGQMFAGEEELQRFCYDHMIEGRPELAQRSAGPEEEQQAVVGAPTLEEAMRAAHAAGLSGAPQLAILPAPPTPADPRPRPAVFAVERVAPFQPIAHHPPQSLMLAAARVHEAKAQRQGKQEEQSKAADVEVTAGSLAGSIREAHAMGLEGSPKAIVYHQADGLEDVYEKAGAGMQGEMLAEDPSSVTVDGATMEQSVEKAKAMGLQGAPEAVIYHPAHGAPETYKLAGEYNVDVPTRTRHHV